MDLFKNTLYINLENRTDRNLHVKTQLSKIGINNAIRLNAVKTTNGAIGCSLSHIKCLEMAIIYGWEYVFICEDDIHFTNPKLLLENMEKFEDLNKKGFQWDVLLVGGNNCPPYEPVLESNGCIVQVSHCRTTIGYIVRNHYYDILIKNLREGVVQLIKEPENKPKYAIDMYWNRLQQTDRWFLLVPLTVSQLQSYSDVEKRVVNYDHLMLDLDKEWLFTRQYQENVMQNMTCIHRKVG
jgi:GR25 family glycosyltransferase involved in LPS biosynthesis